MLLMVEKDIRRGIYHAIYHVSERIFLKEYKN